MLAARLREVFENDDLAVRLGEQAREAAVRRHDPERIISNVCDMYDAVLALNAS